MAWIERRELDQRGDPVDRSCGTRCVIAITPERCTPRLGGGWWTPSGARPNWSSNWPTARGSTRVAVRYDWLGVGGGVD